MAPTPDAAGPANGQDLGEYNVVNSFETGFRFRAVDGNLGKYRSDVNYGNGLRLLGSQLNVHSKDGHGKFFDEIVLTTMGLGNDPYESARLRIQKNGLYRYDMQWRSIDYFNPALTIAQGEHLMDTTRRLQDHDLTLWPQSHFKIRLGYTRNLQTGPALTTTQPLGITSDEFPLFANVRREDNEYRLGGDAEWKGFKLTWQHRWEYFKEDTPLSLLAPGTGNNPADAVTLSSFSRAEPYHGAAPGWLANLNTERKYWALNARITYTSGIRNFIMDESAIGTDRLGAALNRQIVVGGDARRPLTAGDFSFSVFPTDRLTVTNNTSVYNTRIDGNAVFTEFDNATAAPVTLAFQFLGIRTITNSTDANYRYSKWLGFYGGYHYSTRLIRSIEDSGEPSTALTGLQAEQTNHVHAGLAGVRLQPIQPLSIMLEGEVGTSDRPFYPVSDKNYHALGARLRYHAKGVTISGSYRENYNNNSISLTAYSSRARNYSANASWAARNWMSLDAGYSKLHLDTIGGTAFFTEPPQQITGLQSLYISNIHAVNLGARWALGKRADLYAGYSLTKDTGDGRSSASPPGADPVTALLASVQTFPLSFQSPQARLSIRLTDKLRWNAGWQFYRYREQFDLLGVPQNYRAHTGFTSVLWSF